jgi:twitching motility protein PilU
MIDHRNEHTAGHIITVEDPIEFMHDHKHCLITQREIGFDTHSYQNALKNTLRQAPDVILIGEVRDRETWRRPSPSPTPATSASPPCTPTTPIRRSSAS